MGLTTELAQDLFRIQLKEQDIKQLQALHSDTRQDTRYDGMTDLNMRVGHKNIQPNKQQRHEHIRYQIHEQARHRTNHQ